MQASSWEKGSAGGAGARSRSPARQVRGQIRIEVVGPSLPDPLTIEAKSNWSIDVLIAVVHKRAQLEWPTQEFWRRRRLVRGVDWQLLDEAKTLSEHRVGDGTRLYYGFDFDNGVNR